MSTHNELSPAVCPPEVLENPQFTDGLQETIATHMNSGLRLSCLSEAAGELEYANHCKVTGTCALATYLQLLPGNQNQV